MALSQDPDPTLTENYEDGQPWYDVQDRGVHNSGRRGRCCLRGRATFMQTMMNTESLQQMPFTEGFLVSIPIGKGRT